MDIPVPVCHAIPFSPCQGTLDTLSLFLPVLRGKATHPHNWRHHLGGLSFVWVSLEDPLALLPSCVAPSVLVGRDSLLYQVCSDCLWPEDQVVFVASTPSTLKRSPLFTSLS